MDTVESRTEEEPLAETVYDGFISYSHAADDLLAPRLQSGLQRFAKPWWKRRALRIFRDESSLSANPHLWSSITDALDQSGWFVLLLSPDAAGSPWVNNEVEYWLEHKDAGKIIPILTDGDFTWVDDDFISDAAPPALQGTFSDEPRWVDLRFARTEEQLDLKNPTFSAAIADVASAIRGVPKDELESEEVRQHRRTVRTAWAAGFSLLALVIVASGAAVYAVGQQNRANAEADRANAEAGRANELASQEAAARSDAQEQQLAAEAAAANARSEALAAQAVVELDSDPELSVLLAIEALDTDVQPNAVSALHAALQSHRTSYTHRTEDLHNAGISPDGSLLAVWHVDERVELWKPATGELLWTTLLDTSRLPRSNPRGVDFTDDGDHVVVVDSTRFAPYQSGEGMVFLDVDDGSVSRRVDPGDCIITIEPSGMRFVDPVGKLPALWGIENEAGVVPACDITSHRAGYIDLATGDLSVVTQVAGSFALIGGPTLSADGRLFAVGIGSDVAVYDTTTDELVWQFDIPGISTLTADGSRILVGQSPLELRSVEDGSLLAIYQGNLSDAWFGPDESFVYGADFDGSLKLFDTVSGALLRELRGTQTRSAVAQLSADGELLAADEGGKSFRLWDVRSGPITELPAIDLDLPSGSVVVPSAGLDLGGGIMHIPYSPDGMSLHYRIVDLDGHLVRESGSVGWSSMSPEGRYVAEAPIEPGKQTPEGVPAELYGRLQLVDARTGDLVLIFEDTCEFLFNLETSAGEPSASCPDPLEPSDLEFSADGSTLAVRGWGWNSAVFDVASGKRLWTSGPARYDVVGIQAAIGIGPDGRSLVTLAIPGSEEMYLFVDVETSEQLGALTGDDASEAPIQMIFSSTGSHVFVVDAAANLLVIDTDPWELVSTLSRAQGGHLSDVALSPDDRLAATVGIDGVVRVWDWADDTLVQEIDLVTNLTQVEFLDSDSLLVVTRAGDVVVLTLDVAELVGIGRERVTRGFSRIECQTYGIESCL